MEKNKANGQTTGFRSSAEMLAKRDRNADVDALVLAAVLLTRQ